MPIPAGQTHQFTTWTRYHLDKWIGVVREFRQFKDWQRNHKQDGKCKCCLWQIPESAMEQTTHVHQSEAVYQSVVLSSLLYSAETWTISCTEIKKLHTYLMRQLRDVSISWKYKISNMDILHLAGLPSMAEILKEKSVRWLGHIHRMDKCRLKKQLLYSQLFDGHRNQGRPRLRCIDKMVRNQSR